MNFIDIYRLLLEPPNPSEIIQCIRYTTLSSHAWADPICKAAGHTGGIHLNEKPKGPRIII